MPARLSVVGADAGRGSDVPAPGRIPYQTAVQRGRQIVAGAQAAVEQSYWDLGDLACSVESKYGEKTIERLAEDIGVGYSALRNYASVSKAFPAESVPRGTHSWSVYRELAAQENRLELVDSERMTKAQAQELVTQNQAPAPALTPVSAPQPEPEEPGGDDGDEDGPFYTRLYCKTCCREQPVRPGDGVWECTACDSGLVPLDSETVPAAMRTAVGVPDPVAETPLIPEPEPVPDPPAPKSRRQGARSSRPAGRPGTTGNPLVTDDQIERSIRAGRVGRSSFMADYGVNETAAKNAATKAQTLIAERERAAQGPPPGKPQNWDGVSNAKRQRTIKDAQRDAQRAGNEAAERLMQFRRRVVDACRVLESWQPGDLELIRAVDEFADVTYGDIGSCLDDLITLELWLDRTRRTFTLYTDEDKVRTRILKLREQAAHPSTEPAEAAAYTARAGKLERDLESRLGGGR